MIELAFAVITIIGTTAGVWLKLRGELEASRAAAEFELRKMQAEFTRQSGERDDRWRGVLVASNAQWQTYAQVSLEKLQEERDRHIAQLVASLEQARADLQAAVNEAKAAAAKADEVASQNVAEIYALQEQVKALRSDILILQEQNKVLTEQNRLLIEKKDVSPAEIETLSAQVQASKIEPIEEYDPDEKTR